MAMESEPMTSSAYAPETSFLFLVRLDFVEFQFLMLKAKRPINNSKNLFHNRLLTLSCASSMNCLFPTVQKPVTVDAIAIALPRLLSQAAETLWHFFQQTFDGHVVPTIKSFNYKSHKSGDVIAQTGKLTTSVELRKKISGNSRLYVVANRTNSIANWQSKCGTVNKIIDSLIAMLSKAAPKLSARVSTEALQPNSSPLAI